MSRAETQNITVTDEKDKSALERKRWEFTFFPGEYLVLTSYHEETRPTKRHKFKGNKWNRLSRPYSGDLPKPTLEQVPIEVWREAKTWIKHEYEFAIGFCNAESKVEPGDV